MSLRKAINAKCKECIYDPLGGTGTWKKQVVECTSKSCPLWPYRPTPRVTPSKGEIVESSARIQPICTHSQPVQLKEAS
jgi:hypothetical protein